MSQHEQFADDLALYAMGSLRGEERAALEEHLRGCADCSDELARLRGDAALLAFSVSGPQAPARSRARLMTAIGREPRFNARPSKRASWFRMFELAGAVAAVVIISLFVKQESALRTRVSELEASSAAQQVQLDDANRLMASLTSPEAERFTLVASNAPPQPQGKAIYVRGSGVLMFLATNMPAPPPQKAYELWVIPTEGAPIPAGVFRPDAHGSATVFRPPLPAGVQAKTIAITVEPEAGSPAPTSKPIMVGTEG
jgi:anti-sigma-K factor RskA